MEFPTESVVAPKFTPAVPPVTLLPGFTLRVWLLMASVPNVCTMPLPGVARLELIITGPPRVVGCALTEESVAKSSVPPFRTRVDNALPNAPGLLNVNVPVLSVVTPPVRVPPLLPFKVNWPTSCLVIPIFPVKAPNVKFAPRPIS